MSAMSSILLRSGGRMPQVGLGTAGIGGMTLSVVQEDASQEAAMAALDAALECGYRHIDTATMYCNESLIGEVLQKWLSSGRISREELFITTKLPNNALRSEDVQRFLERSRERLRVSYVDLYLIHSPVGTKSENDDVAYPVDQEGMAVLDMATNLEAVWATMEKQVDAGRTKAIGLSCFNSKQIERIMKVANIPPAILEIEVHAYLQQRQLRALCASHNISVCAFCPLGAPHRAPGTSSHPKLLEHPIVTEISSRIGRTPAQVLLRHLIQHGLIVIPKSINPARLKSNAQVFDFELSEEDMTAMNALDCGPESRISHLLYFKGADKHPEYPYSIPF